MSNLPHISSIDDGFEKLPLVSVDLMFNMEKKEETKVEYEATHLIDLGAFGKVYEIIIKNETQKLSLKRVLVDESFQSRELQILKILNHANIIRLFYFFYKQHNNNNFLNLITQRMDTNLSKLIYKFRSNFHQIPLFYVKIFTFQIAKSLAYLHNLNIAHRDLKPDNILLNIHSSEILLCDFGSAKFVSAKEKNSFYICSRSYRAPELLFRSTNYQTEVDLWSFGCIFADMILSKTLFQSKDDTLQVIEIIKILGTPTEEDFVAMNPSFCTRFQKFDRLSWRNVFSTLIPEEALTIPESLIVYNPKKRIKAINILGFKFFNEIFEENIRLPNGNILPKQLFWFTTEELSNIEPNALKKLKNHSNFKEI